MKNFRQDLKQFKAKIAGGEIILLLLIAFFLRLVAAYFSEGFNHPDEDMQVLEPAHGLLYGYWIKAWEWEQGIRSWVLPAVYAAWMKFFSLFGIEDPVWVATLLRAVTGFFSLFMLWTVYWLGLFFSPPEAGKRPALLATAFLTFWWIYVYFGVRTMSEISSMVVVMLSFAAFFSKRIGLSGALMGLAFAFRFSSALFGVGLGLVLLVQRRFREFALFSIAVLILVFFQGIVDWVTWGHFLHSPLQYFIFNVWSGGAAESFGADPWHRYITALSRFFSFPGAVILLLGCLTNLFSDFKRTWQLWVPVILFCGAHTLIAHKEDRLLLPVLPLLVLLGTIGLDQLISRAKIRVRRAAWVTVLLLLLVGGAERYNAVQWTQHSFIPRYLNELYYLPDLEGVGVLFKAFNNGYFYLHRDVPFVRESEPRKLVSQAVKKNLNYLVIFGPPELVIAPLAEKGVRCAPFRSRWGAPIYRCGG